MISKTYEQIMGRHQNRESTGRSYRSLILAFCSVAVCIYPFETGKADGDAGKIPIELHNPVTNETSNIWMRAPALGIMPHMIANVTKDVPKWDEGLGDKFDAEE